jgi:hypothetical protein
MIYINSETELLSAFRLIDREEVQIPRALQLPLKVDDYVTWIEPSGSRIYLIIEEKKKQLPFGIVFRRDQDTSGSYGMCEWCHSVRSGNGVALLTATASSHRRVGINLCRDLDCKEKAELPPGPNDIPQLLSSQDRIQKITQRMFNFAKQNLF